MIFPMYLTNFYRADKSRDRKSGGTGIGLAIVKQLAELHGGYVKAESHVGKGSVFTVFLPCGKENAAIKKQEKAGKEWTEAYLPGALEEAEKLLERAEERKGIKK